jgi:hypothetical protein
MSTRKLMVLSRDGKSLGEYTGAERCCTMEGCTGVRKQVRWPDGKSTWPCSKSIVSKSKFRDQII